LFWVNASAEIAPDARLEHQLQRLDRLCDLGLQIAEGLADQARGRGPQVVEGDVALAYDRVARAVRMAILLQARLTEEQRASVQTPAEPLADAESARKDQVARIVRRVAEGDGRLNPSHIIAAGRLARERLEHDDIYGKVMSQPVSDLVADICHDIGLTPDWEKLAWEAWAQEEMDSSEVGEALRALCAEEEETASSPVHGGGGPEGRRGHAELPPPEPPS
jgi:hypothetical protein